MNPPSISKDKGVSFGQTAISVVGWIIMGIMFLLLILGVCSGVLKK